MLDDQLKQSIREYGIMILKSLLLLNGGAILAIFGLIGAAIGREQPDANLEPRDFIWAFAAYAAGLVLVILGMITGFFNWQYAAQENYRAVTKTYRVAVAFGFAALFAFIGGCVAVYVAVS